MRPSRLAAELVRSSRATARCAARLQTVLKECGRMSDEVVRADTYARVCVRKVQSAACNDEFVLDPTALVRSQTPCPRPVECCLSGRAHCRKPLQRPGPERRKIRIPEVRAPPEHPACSWALKSLFVDDGDPEAPVEHAP